MPVQPTEIAIGPVRLAALPHVRGAGDAAARAWLGDRLGRRPMDLAAVRDAHGRPVLGLDGHDCNWSHSGAWLLVALGTGVRVGVDIEAMRPRPKALEIARRYFHPHEAEVLASVPAQARDEAFLRLWCAKEAVLKAHGRGLAYGLDRIEVAGFAPGAGELRLVAADGAIGPAARWRLQPVAIEDAVAAVAWREA